MVSRACSSASRTTSIKRASFDCKAAALTAAHCAGAASETDAALLPNMRAMNWNKVAPRWFAFLVAGVKGPRSLLGVSPGIYIELSLFLCRTTHLHTQDPAWNAVLVTEAFCPQPALSPAKPRACWE